MEENWAINFVIVVYQCVYTRIALIYPEFVQSTGHLMAHFIGNKSY